MRGELSKLKTQIQIQIQIQIRIQIRAKPLLDPININLSVTNLIEIDPILPNRFFLRQRRFSPEVLEHSPHSKARCGSQAVGEFISIHEAWLIDQLASQGELTAQELEDLGVEEEVEQEFVEEVEEMVDWYSEGEVAEEEEFVEEEQQEGEEEMVVEDMGVEAQEGEEEEEAQEGEEEEMVVDDMGVEAEEEAEEEIGLRVEAQEELVMEMGVSVVKLEPEEEGRDPPWFG